MGPLIGRGGLGGGGRGVRAWHVGKWHGALGMLCEWGLAFLAAFGKPAMKPDRFGAGSVPVRSSPSMPEPDMRRTAMKGGLWLHEQKLMKLHG